MLFVNSHLCYDVCMNPVRIILIVALGVLLPVFSVFYLVPAFRGEIDILSGLYLGSVHIRFYGLLMAMAVLVGFFIASWYAPKFGIEKKDVEAALPWVVVFGFLGARLYYVVFSWNEFPSLLDVVQVWKGGLSIYGGVIGGILGMFVYVRRRGVRFMTFLDLFATALPLGMSIGRWGNFFNQEAFGTPTNLPWKMYIEPAHRPFQYLFNMYFHPTFLYESLWDICVFFILLYLLYSLKVGVSPGRLAGSGLILYSLGRFFIESLRVDSFFINSIRVDQVTSLVMMVAGTIILFTSYEKAKQNLESN